MCSTASAKRAPSRRPRTVVFGQPLARQRQAERIEGRMRVGAAAKGNLVGLLRSIGAAQFDHHPPFHPPAPGLPCADVSTPMFGTVSRSVGEPRLVHVKFEPGSVE